MFGAYSALHVTIDGNRALKNCLTNDPGAFAEVRGCCLHRRVARNLTLLRRWQEKKVRWGNGTDGMLRLGAKTIPPLTFTSVFLQKRERPRHQSR